jgi:5-(carboxyamino)imidazole ribonucleotide synthase
VTTRVGILGGGQLGLLLAQSLIRLGCEVSVYDPDVDAPACKQTSFAFNGSWTDNEKLNKFFSGCDIVTYEFENVETDLLFALQKLKPLFPAAEVLYTTQNRGREKSFLKDNELPHPTFHVVPKGADLTAAVHEFGLPCIAKTTFGGYDGKGQFSLDSEERLRDLVSKLVKSPVELILEEPISLDAEVSCIVGRSRNGESIVFPVFENHHRDHILDITLLPARVPQEVQEKARDLAKIAASKLEVVGLLTVEFFLTKTKPRGAAALQVGEWHVLINEFAPRPHNSGHITMKACDLSQFDVLARALLDIPLSEPKMASDAAFCMGNLLGDLWLEQRKRYSPKSHLPGLNLSKLAQFPEVIDIIDYGKKEPREKRKMGHFIAKAESADKLIKVADRFRSELASTEG